MPSAVILRQCPVCGLALPDPLPPACPRTSCGVEFVPGDAGRARLRTFRLVGHYSLFVLPFSFPETDGADPVRRVAESGRWRQRTFSAADPADVDRTEYFLPYIRRFLFPTLYDAPGAAKGAASPSPTCRHFEFDLARLGGGPKGVEWSLRCHDGRKRISFEHLLRLPKAELIVFSFRVGFLVLRVECADEGATYFDQMNVVAYLRTIAPLYRGFEMPLLMSGAAGYGVPQLLPFLLAEFGGALLPPGPESVPATAPLPVRPIYDDRMMVYTDNTKAVANDKSFVAMSYGVQIPMLISPISLFLPDSRPILYRFCTASRFVASSAAGGNPRDRSGRRPLPTPVRPVPAATRQARQCRLLRGPRGRHRCRLDRRTHPVAGRQEGPGEGPDPLRKPRRGGQEGIQPGRRLLVGRDAADRDEMEEGSRRAQGERGDAPPSPRHRPWPRSDGSKGEGPRQGGGPGSQGENRGLQAGATPPAPRP
jgi:hypothetical protein